MGQRGCGQSWTPFKVKLPNISGRLTNSSRWNFPFTTKSSANDTIPRKPRNMKTIIYWSICSPYIFLLLSIGPLCRLVPVKFSKSTFPLVTYKIDRRVFVTLMSTQWLLCAWFDVFTIFGPIFAFSFFLQIKRYTFSLLYLRIIHYWRH